MGDTVTIITPTGGRPQAFSLCRRFIERQTYAGPIRWLVVDDGEPQTACAEFERNGLLKKCSISVAVISPRQRWKPEEFTLGRNILAALPYIEGDKLLFCEDDDWYAPDYVEHVAGLLEHNDIAGGTSARFYNIPCRKYGVEKNMRNACLGETAIRASVLPCLIDLCTSKNVFSIDNKLWQYARDFGSRIGLSRSVSRVGIKGLPGRRGFSGEHRLEPHSGGAENDPTLAKLREWIGEDVAVYREFLWDK
jgi:glycosyltransferase involved in cell wall biosynthesis